MEYKKEGDYVLCRICGKKINYKEPRLETSVIGYRRIISIAIHPHHLCDREVEKIILNKL